MKFFKFQEAAPPVVPMLSRILLFLVFCAPVAVAQRPYTVVRPRERSASENITIRTKPGLPSKGVLAVVLNPIVSGQVLIKDSTGKLISTLETDKDGQAEIQLARNKIYQVEASSPGYIGAKGKSKPLQASEVIRLNLTPQFAQLGLLGLPTNAQVLIDGELKATADQTGLTQVNELKPGDHSLLVRHPEYNDYTYNLKGLEAGTTPYWQIVMTRVAKLTIQGPAGATVMIDGVLQGKIQDDGTVSFDYELKDAAEKTISVEQLGYQTWSKPELLTPGTRTIQVKLDPILTSTGVSDLFTDSLSLWNAPSTWELVTSGKDKRLRVKGSELGILKNTVYRDIQKESNFLVWLDDGKGATWAMKADKEGRNYYLFHLAGPNSTTHTPRKFYTYVVKDGGAPVAVSTPFPVLMELDQKTSYTINFEISGNQILHWITSNETGQQVELGAWTDTSLTKDKFLYGTFGFRSLAGEIFSVDEFTIAPKK